MQLTLPPRTNPLTPGEPHDVISLPQTVERYQALPPVEVVRDLSQISILGHNSDTSSSTEAPTQSKRGTSYYHTIAVGLLKASRAAQKKAVADGNNQRATWWSNYRGAVYRCTELVDSACASCGTKHHRPFASCGARCCPYCHYRRTRNARNRMEELLPSLQPCHSFFLTLTHPHSPEQTLTVQMEAIDGAVRRLVESRLWRKPLAAALAIHPGISHRGGWHVHCHALIFLPQDWSPEQCNAWAHSVLEFWCNTFPKADEEAQKWQHLSPDEVPGKVGYILKPLNPVFNKHRQERDLQDIASSIEQIETVLHHRRLVRLYGELYGRSRDERAPHQQPARSRRSRCPDCGATNSEVPLTGLDGRKRRWE